MCMMPFHFLLCPSTKLHCDQTSFLYLQVEEDDADKASVDYAFAHREAILPSKRTTLMVQTENMEDKSRTPSCSQAKGPHPWSKQKTRKRNPSKQGGPHTWSKQNTWKRNPSKPIGVLETSRSQGESRPELPET